MPGVGNGKLVNKKPIFCSESCQDANADVMRTQARVDENVGSRLRNGHAHHVRPPRRTESEPLLDWEKLEKKYSKVGRNGYKKKDIADQIKYMSLREVNSNTDSMRNGSEESSVLKVNTYAGRRDISDPSTVQEKQIVSSRGTVRGFKNRVRAGIATFLQQQAGDSLDEDDVIWEQRNFRHLEKGKVIIYTTSMAIVRSTYERCKKVKKILQTHMVRYEEKDLFMSKENQKELADRLNSRNIVLPQVFADGASLGSYEDLEKLNESGELRHLLANFTKIDVKSSCDKCGGYRFIPCNFCHGSKKSLRRNNFTDEFCALRCMQCDENGLLRCDLCLDQQE